MTTTRLDRRDFLAQDWRDDAACKGMDLNLFYPPDPDDRSPLANGEPRPRYSEAKAKRICRGCPVRAECGDDALARHEKWGVHGGMTEDDKVGERRRRMRAGTLYAA